MPENDMEAAENTLDIELNIHDEGDYSLVLNYDASRFSEGSMRRFAESYEKIVRGLMEEGRPVTGLLAE